MHTSPQAVSRGKQITLGRSLGEDGMGMRSLGFREHGFISCWLDGLGLVIESLFLNFLTFIKRDILVIYSYVTNHCKV